MSRLLDLAQRLQAAKKHDRSPLQEEVAAELGMPLDTQVHTDVEATYHAMRARFPTITWAAGIGHKGSQAQVGDQKATSSAGPGAAFAAALLLYMNSTGGV